MILHGVEGIGKTSMPAYGPSPIYLMSSGETGLETLIDHRRLPQIDHLPELQTWSELFEALDVVEELDHKTLVIDTLNGVERMCHEYVCRTQFGNKWGKDGFSSYQQGFLASLTEWRKLLQRLDSIRERKRMSIVCLCHTKISPFHNPEGADYDRWTPDMHHKTWGLSHRWADMVLFANHFTVVDDTGTRAKGAGGKERLIYTEHSSAYDAKNRLGLPPMIEMGRSAKEAWDNFIAELKKGKTK